jgi:hypothetical protein
VDIESDAGFLEALKYQDDQAAGDRALAVRFYTDEFVDEVATKREGRPIYKTQECVEIRAPGSRDVKMGRIKYMQPDPRIRFARAYANWKAGREVQVEGQLLRAWGFLTPARVKEYEAMHVHTVEQLAGLDDVHSQDIPGSLAERTKARDFLEMAKGAAPLAQARAETAKVKAELEALKEQVQAMLGEGRVEEPPPKRRGRPLGSKNKPKDAVQEN